MNQSILFSPLVFGESYIGKQLGLPRIISWSRLIAACTMDFKHNAAIALSCNLPNMKSCEPPCHSKVCNGTELSVSMLRKHDSVHTCLVSKCRFNLQGFMLS